MPTKVPRKFLIILFVLGMPLLGAWVASVLLHSEHKNGEMVAMLPVREMQVPVTIIVPTEVVQNGSKPPTVTPAPTASVRAALYDMTPTPSANGGPLRLTADADGYKLYVDSGVTHFGEQTFGSWGSWIGSSRMVVDWLSQPYDGAGIHDGYMLNFEEGKIEKLPGYKEGMQAYTRTDGKMAVLLDVHDGRSPRIYLSNVETGEVQTVYDLDKHVSQWAGNEMRPKEQELSITDGDVTWLGKNAIAINVSPGLRVPISEYGANGEHTLLLVDIPGRKIHVVKGSLVGGLPDGTVIIQHDTEQGAELQIIAPPFDDAPITISEPGTWISSIEARDDGKYVAWIESHPPSNVSLDDQHMGCFEGCGFKPKPLAVAFWETETGTIRKLDLGSSDLAREGIDLYSLNLSWSRKGTSVFYDALESDGSIAPYRVYMDGRVEALGVPKMVCADIADRGITTVMGEGTDGTLYFSCYWYPEEAPLVVQQPDGTQKTLAGKNEGVLATTWSSTGTGQLLLQRADGVEIIETATGRTQLIKFPVGDVFSWVIGEPALVVTLSRDGKWLVYLGRNADRYSSSDYTSHGLVLRVLKVE